MKRRKRWRRFAMWAGLAACGACALLFVANFIWVSLAVCYQSPGRVWGAYVGSQYGSIIFGRVEELSWDAGPCMSEPAEGFQSVVLGRELSWQHLAWIASGMRLFPTVSSHRLVGTLIVVPKWIPFLLFAVPTCFLWRAERRDRKRAAAGACSACGYDLTGNVTGRCTECGAAADSPLERKLHR